MKIDIDNIRSKTALLETASALRAMAETFENQAKILDDRRNYYGIGEHDKSTLARALNYVKLHPKFPLLSASECREICDRFSLDYLPNAEFLMRAQRKSRDDFIKKRNQAMRKMRLKQYKNKEIAKKFGLSEAQTSTILRPKPARG